MLQERVYNAIVVLGCGQSILDLNVREKAYINKCKIVIAVNKFMAFYDLTSLKPNYIYFHDEMENSILMFQHILEKCRKDGLSELRIFTNHRFRMLTSKMWLPYLIYLKSRSFLKWHILKKRLWLADKVYIKLPFKRIAPPINSNIIEVKIENIDAGKNWAKNLNDYLFNYKGSLSSILNLCSIISPHTPIYLVGNDFNGSKYFFQDELERLSFSTYDYTTNIVKKENRHMSFVKTNGGKSFKDKIPAILSNLHKTGNSLYCTNAESLLVTEAGVDYKKLPYEEI